MACQCCCKCSEKPQEIVVNISAVTIDAAEVGRLVKKAIKEAEKRGL